LIQVLNNLFNQQPHKAYSVTGALGTATAALIPGTIINQILHNNMVGALRIGNPEGVMRVEVSLVKNENEWRLSRAIVERTARELMQGQAFLSWEKILTLRDKLLTENSVEH
jgi:2-methylaconitate cis-trans-isomerase PrpF